MPKKRKRTAKLVSCGNEEKENGKDLRKRPSAGCLTDGSNLSTSPSEIQQQQHISEHHTPSRSRLSPYPVHMMYQGPLGESTPNAAQDIENSLFGFDWSTPLIASPSIVSPSIVSSPMLSPIVSSYATPRKKSKLSRNALQDTPLSSRVHQQVEAKRKPKAATPKKRYVVYNMPVQPLKVNRNDKPRKNNWKMLKMPNLLPLEVSERRSASQFKLVRAVHNISFDSRYTPGIVNSIYELQPHDSKPSALYSNDSKADGHYICGEELCLVLLCNEMKERGASMWVFLFHVGANEAAELEEWMKKVNAEFAEIEKHELAVVYDK